MHWRQKAGKDFRYRMTQNCWFNYSKVQLKIHDTFFIVSRTNQAQCIPIIARQQCSLGDFNFRYCTLRHSSHIFCFTNYFWAVRAWMPAFSLIGTYMVIITILLQTWMWVIVDEEGECTLWLGCKDWWWAKYIVWWIPGTLSLVVAMVLDRRSRSRSRSETGRRQIHCLGRERTQNVNSGKVQWLSPNPATLGG